MSRLVDHTEFDPSACSAARTQARQVLCITRTFVIALGEACDCHRAFALAVNLHKPRPKQIERFDQVADIHRAAAIKAGRQVPGGVGDPLGRADHARQHGRRSEHRHLGIALQRLEHDVCRKRRLDYLVAAGENVRQRIEASAVRQRRDMEHGLAGKDLLDVRSVLQAHCHQVAVRQHRALGNACGPAGIENPGQVVGLHRLAGDRRRACQPFILVAVTDDDARIDRLRRKLLHQALEQRGTRDDQAGAGVCRDRHDLARV